MATHTLRLLGIGPAAALAGALVLGLVSSASAAPILSNPTIVSGNITFDNFTCSSVPLCTGLDVSAHTSAQPIDLTTGDFGIRITGNLTALAGQVLDINIQ